MFNCSPYPNRIVADHGHGVAGQDSATLTDVAETDSKAEAQLAFCSLRLFPEALKMRFAWLALLMCDACGNVGCVQMCAKYS